MLDRDGLENLNLKSSHVRCHHEQARMHQKTLGNPTRPQTRPQRAWVVDAAPRRAQQRKHILACTKEEAQRRKMRQN